MMGAAVAVCRTLGREDYSDAIALYRDLSVDVPVADGALGAEMFGALIDHPGTSVLGADIGGRVVSMATLHVLPNMTYGGRPYALVENVVTLKSHHRQGLGRQVMEAVAATAWEQNCYKIMLLTGRYNVAKGFYERLGYTAGEKHGMVLRRAHPPPP
ncbi:GNAT family N-acetyltransferase [Actibacterium sp. 188UL27-1]|uniref:GNAT family N-acetyltransferase n=1 Tax=Actibacterium sp. 188UL27-1 TaxID=2786961 RepID=UPI00195D8311|nr:GNAT family N-acetyltransferase [Actibacterium sp. 188UL27-1]MBM7066789.1 GNAT family N-acetyltransferase [Actibacterium sp. 188UL27-1]